MDDQDLICVCMTVTREEIIQAIESGAQSIESLKAQLMCCTGCGTCEPKVKKILAEILESKSAIRSAS